MKDFYFQKSVTNLHYPKVPLFYVYLYILINERFRTCFCMRLNGIKIEVKGILTWSRDDLNQGLIIAQVKWSVNNGRSLKSSWPQLNLWFPRNTALLFSHPTRLLFVLVYPFLLSLLLLRVCSFFIPLRISLEHRCCHLPTWSSFARISILVLPIIIFHGVPYLTRHSMQPRCELESISIRTK